MRAIAWIGMPALAGMLLTACSDGPSSPPLDGGPVHLVEVSGDAQVGPVGAELPEALVVRATDEKGHPQRDLLVNFVITAGGGHVFAGSALTDRAGYAREYWTLGAAPGENRLEVRVLEEQTGVKLVLGEFTALGVAGPADVCDGIDNDGDGAADEDLRYCFGGAPAPHTDGADCDENWADVDREASTGCETTLIEDTYFLEPAIVVDCPATAELAGVFTIDRVVIQRFDEGNVLMSFDVAFESLESLDMLVAIDDETLRFEGGDDFFFNGGYGLLSIEGGFDSASFNPGRFTALIRIEMYTAGACDVVLAGVAGQR